MLVITISCVEYDINYFLIFMKTLYYPNEPG